MFAVIRAGLQQKKRAFGIIGAEYSWRWLLLWNTASLVKQVWQQPHKTTIFTAANELNTIQEHAVLPSARWWSTSTAAVVSSCCSLNSALWSVTCGCTISLLCASTSPSHWWLCYEPAAWEKQAINKDDWHVCCGRIEKVRIMFYNAFPGTLMTYSISTYFTYRYLFRVDSLVIYEYQHFLLYQGIGINTIV